jgi:broad specificity phosphatase PhoE
LKQASHAPVAEKKTLILVRHGSLDEQYDGCYIGSSDLPLSREGIREAEALGSFLKTRDIDSIYASPLLRSRQTVEKVSLALPETPVVYEDLLREIDFGAWEGLTFAQICKHDPDGAGRWAGHDDEFTFPGGEILGNFHDRIRRIKQMLLDSEHENILLVSHGGVILNLICNILDIGSRKALSLKVDRGSLSTLSLFPNGLGILNSLNFKPGS